MRTAQHDVGVTRERRVVGLGGNQPLHTAPLSKGSDVLCVQSVWGDRDRVGWHGCIG